jgi:type I restriction-modification system DNA methylase subunit
MTAKKEYWQINTARIADEIRSAASEARTEEDLKMRVEPILRRSFKDIGIDIDIVAYEKATALRAKMDAVYGYLIIEYKVPGKLSTAPGQREAKKQLQRYLLEESIKHRPQEEAFLEKAIGVSIDGKMVMFVRYTQRAKVISTPLQIAPDQRELFPEKIAKAGFHALGPYPITKDSLTNLLIFVRAAARRPLTAKDLSEVFGPEHDVARQAVSEIYSAVMRAQRLSAPSRVKAFFTEWDRIFGVVYGQELGKAEKTAEETAHLYQMPGGVRLKQLLFAIHTYYAFLMKIIAVELLAMQRESTLTSFVRDLGSLDDDALKERLSRLESGADFIDQGIENFLEADFFRWYLDGWNKSLANAFRTIVRALSSFEPATPVLEPDWTRDLLKKLYEMIVPRKLRHDLGEFYTPDWLAGYLIERSGCAGDPNTRFLDPACGSGTFLVEAIHRVIQNNRSRKKSNWENIGRLILNNIVGFDLNPLAVLAARTNYLIAFAPFIPFVRPISIPVYLCDSVLAPTRASKEGELDFGRVAFSTTKGDFLFPSDMQDKEKIDHFTYLIEIGLKGKQSPEDFSTLLKKRLPLSEGGIKLLLRVYARIRELEEQGENGIWARYIKNAFAPVYLARFDYVIGNPPWIRWGYLSDDYRKRTLDLWQRYGLFSLKGHEARLGAGEKDFSMLFTYASCDNYLKEGGKLAFLITHEVFKSKGAGEGFRKFEIEDKKIPLRVTLMEDMVDLKPFQAANKTSLFVLEKGKPTSYPIPVVIWRRLPGTGAISPDWPLSEVMAHTKGVEVKAVPVDSSKVNSSWQTATPSSLKWSEKMKGENPYKARLGARVEPYGVFWLRIKEVRPDGLLVVENMMERGKRDIPSTSAAIEKDLVYPAVSGGDIIPFGVKSHFYVLIAQDPVERKGYEEAWMSSNLPLTLAYLTQFRTVLVKRAAYQKYFHKEIKVGNKVIKREPIAPFYSMYNISQESFSKYRVVWKRMASKMASVVISRLRTPFGLKTVISTDTTSFFAAEDEREAHYLCGILNSKVVDEYIRSFSSAGRGFGAPSVMNNLAIPKFSSNNKIHMKIVELSQRAHDLVTQGREIEKLQDELNEAVKKLWNIKS